MRVALTNPDVSLAGGVERVITEVANRLSAGGHDVTVYAARVAAGVTAPGVKIHTIAVPRGMDAWSGLGFRGRCARAVLRDAPDAHGAFSALSPPTGLFWVPSVHRQAYEELLARRTGARSLSVRAHPYHRIRLELESSMFAGADGVLAQTGAVRQEVAHWYGRQDVDVLPLGFNQAQFNPRRRAQQRSEARRRFGYGKDDCVLLFIGNELERKGFDQVLKALAQRPEVKLLGAGRVAPGQRNELVRVIGDRLQWVGQLSEVDLLHAAADGLVLPTRYEPWGLVIVEALASGLPVVTSRLAGAASAVRNRETGWLLDDPEDVDALIHGIDWLGSGAPSDPEVIADSVGSYEWGQIVTRYERFLVSAAT